MEVGEASVGGMSAFHSGMFGKDAEEDEKKKAAEREKFLSSVRNQQQQQSQQQQQPLQTSTISHQQSNDFSADDVKAEVPSVDEQIKTEDTADWAEDSVSSTAQTWNQSDQLIGYVDKSDYIVHVGIIFCSYFSETHNDEDDGQMEEEMLPQSNVVHAEVQKATIRRDTGSPPPNPLDLLRKERENPNIFQEREDKRLKAEEEVRLDQK